MKMTIPVTMKSIQLEGTLGFVCLLACDDSDNVIRAQVLENFAHVGDLKVYLVLDRTDK